MAYKQKNSPLNHVNSWEEEDVKRGIKLEKEGKKGHAEALFDDAHDSNRYRGGNDGSEPFHMSRELSEGGDIIDETAQRSGSFMSQHSQSSPLNQGVHDAETEDMPLDNRMGNLTKKETVPVPAHRGVTSQINLGGGKSLVGFDFGPRGHKYTSEKKVKNENKAKKITETTDIKHK